MSKVSGLSIAHDPDGVEHKSYTRKGRCSHHPARTIGSRRCLQGLYNQSPGIYKRTIQVQTLQCGQFEGTRGISVGPNTICDPSVSDTHDDHRLPYAPQYPRYCCCAFQQ